MPDPTIVAWAGIGDPGYNNGSVADAGPCL